MASGMSTELINGWCQHVDMETQNARVYLVIAMRLKSMGQKPLARMFKEMSKEENCHAIAFAKHAARRGGPLLSGALDPISDVAAMELVDLAKLSLEREEETLASMENLFELSDEISRSWLSDRLVDQQHEVHRAEARVYATEQLGANGLLLASETVLEGK